VFDRINNGGAENRDAGLDYIMNSKGIAPPSPFYYDVIRKGYEMNGLDIAVLEQARQESLTDR
jgi:hypothetical protein